MLDNYAFLDGQNVFMAVKNMKWKLDFARFRVYLHDKYNVKKAYYFIGYQKNKEWLYKELTEAGYLLVHKKTIKVNGKVKGNVDAELVLHTMIELNNFERAVIVSGDGDFRCLVKYLRDKDKLERLIVPNRNRYPSLLREFRPYTSFLNGAEEKFGKK